MATKVSFVCHPEQDDPYKHSESVLSHFQECRILFSHWRCSRTCFHPLLCHQSVQVFNCFKYFPWFSSCFHLKEVVLTVCPKSSCPLGLQECLTNAFHYSWGLWSNSLPLTLGHKPTVLTRLRSSWHDLCDNSSLS